MFPRIPIVSILAAVALAATTPSSAGSAGAPESGAPGSRPTVIQPAATRGVAAPAKRITVEERALLEIEADGQRQVVELSKALAALPPGPERRALSARITQIKQETLVKLLRARAGFALQRGDLAAAREIELVIEDVLHPHVPAPPAESRAKPQVKEGGRP
jgi:hypothetical protein